MFHQTQANAGNGRNHSTKFRVARQAFRNTRGPRPGRLRLHCAERQPLVALSPRRKYPNAPDQPFRPCCRLFDAKREGPGVYDTCCETGNRIGTAPIMLAACLTEESHTRLVFVVIIVSSSGGGKGHIHVLSGWQPAIYVHMLDTQVYWSDVGSHGEEITLHGVLFRPLPLQ